MAGAATAGTAAAGVGAAMHAATSSRMSPSRRSSNGTAESALRHSTQVPANRSDEIETDHWTQRPAHESRTGLATSSATSSTAASSRPPAKVDTSRADATVASVALVGSPVSSGGTRGARAVSTAPRGTNGDRLSRSDSPSSDGPMSSFPSTSRAPSSSSPQSVTTETPSPQRPAFSTNVGDAPVPMPTSTNQPATRPTSFPSAVPTPGASPVSSPVSPQRLNPSTRDEEGS